MIRCIRVQDGAQFSFNPDDVAQAWETAHGTVEIMFKGSTASVDFAGVTLADIDGQRSVIQVEAVDVTPRRRRLGKGRT